MDAKFVACGQPYGKFLLREVGIKSHSITVQADDEEPSFPDWPIPFQFNHAVIGIEVDSSIHYPTVLANTCGRLLIFDPTDPDTPVGGLPSSIQGRKAALLATASDQLIELPDLSPKIDKSIIRTVQLDLHVNGDVDGHCTAVFQGQEGTRARRLFRTTTQHDINTYGAPDLFILTRGVQTKNLVTKDEPRADRFD